MAFTLHWPNTCTQRYSTTTYTRSSMGVIGAYNNRICSLTSGLSLQADVIFPNADAGISQLPDTDTPTAVGCVGNQLDNVFPLEPRTPVALPLVMYPTKTDGILCSEQDICAFPVLNWEQYIRELYTSISHTGNASNSSESRKWKRLLQDEAEQEPEGSDNMEEEESTSPPAPTNFVPTIPSTNSSGQTKRRRIPVEVTRLYTVNPVDVEADEREPRDKRKKVGRPPKPKLPSKFTPSRRALKLKTTFTTKVEKVPKKGIRMYMNQPTLKVQGTWNYLYNGTGACNWIYDSRNKTHKTIFVGNGPKLRMISLKLSKATQMLSYTVDNVWEEDEIPSNVNSCKAKAGDEDTLSDIVFEIKTLRRRNQLAVRRGKSIEVYYHDDVPSLVASIPNINYGNERYVPRKKYGKIRKPNPFLTSFDMNSNFPSQLVTMDENALIQFIDIEEGKVIHQVDGRRTSRPETDSAGRLPKFRLNDFCGVSYTAGHPSVIYYWCDSNIFLYDRRMRPPKTKPVTIELFNLRSSPSSLAMCEQDSFKNPKDLVLWEDLSSFVVSRNPLHYYLGTTERIFLMDVRVPNNPIVRLNHGMASPPAFMDVFSDENYESLVAGSQRNSETFCAILETSHVSCMDRSGCQKRNPILYSYPRHLSNSREYFDFSHSKGLGCEWETDFQRAKDHCYAWTTGLCVMKPPKLPRKGSLPSPFILFNGNSFGDVFLQEWNQKPISSPTKVEATDERLNSFLIQWKDSMVSPVGKEAFLQSRSRTSDFSLLIESSAESLKKSQTIRMKPFDSFTPHALVYHRVRDGLPSFQEQIASLRSIPSKRVQNFLNVWTEEETPECDDRGNEVPLADLKVENDENKKNESGLPPTLVVKQLVQVKAEVEGFTDDLSDVDIFSYWGNEHPSSMSPVVDLTQPHYQPPSPQLGKPSIRNVDEA